jgi:hypothetical protein
MLLEGFQSLGCRHAITLGGNAIRRRRHGKSRREQYEADGLGVHNREPVSYEN